MSFPKIERAVFYTLLAAWLLPLLTVEYFVTGDGPCHLYNSRVLLDWWSDRHVDFYEKYYHLNPNFDPNWISSFIMMQLLKIAFPPQAERLYLMLYVLTFALGFRVLLRQFNPSAVFLSSLALVFTYHHIVLMGFYNNSMSLALWFWVVAAWWRWRDVASAYRQLALTLLFVVLYSAHPIGFLFTGMMIAALIAGEAAYDLAAQMPFRQVAERVVRRGAGLLAASLPGLILLVEFRARHPFKANESAGMANAGEDLLRLTPLASLDTSEAPLALAVAIICILLGIAAVVQRLRTRRLDRADGLVLFTIAATGILFFVPESLRGMEMHRRMTVVPYLGLLLWAGLSDFPRTVRYAVLALATVLTAAFLYLRLPTHWEASRYASEVATCADQIEDRTVVEVLNYEWGGRLPDGRTIGDRIWLFNHVSAYAAVRRTCILSDNYEANYWYFPIVWRWQANLYTQTDKDNINFDHRPPRADLLSFPRRTSLPPIDYVMMIGYSEQYRDHPYTQEIFMQLDSAYRKIYTSENGVAVLYRKKQ
jgi:hypothetical protein